MSSLESSFGKIFTHKRINVVLDEINFLLWKQQVLLTVRSHRLEKLLTGKKKPPPETVTNDGGESVPNDAYEVFCAQDSALASWLLSTISAHMLPLFVGAETAFEVWDTVLKFFASRSTTSVMSLHCKLRSIKKGEQSMRSYLTQIKEVCDALGACGSKVSDVEHIATILNGLPSEYQPFMAVITSSKEPFFLDGIKYVLIDAETQLRGFHTETHLPMVVNVAHVQHTHHVGHQDSRNCPFYNGGRTGSRGRDRMRLQCQLCGKNGHSADRCWRRFDKSFPRVLSRTIEDQNEATSMSGRKPTMLALHVVPRRTMELHLTHGWLILVRPTM